MTSSGKNHPPWAVGAALLALSLALGCGYYYVAGPLQPTTSQTEEMSVDDDLGVTFVRGRLEVRLRPVTAEELNTQFASSSEDGQKSTNPYTYGNTTFQDGLEHERFTVFHLHIKNYAYPKVRIDPTKIEISSANKRQYWALDLEQLDNYYRGYSTGYRGNEYDRYQRRMEHLRRTMYPAEPVYSGQESEGFLVFPALHVDVRDVEIIIHDAALRFDVRDEPVETVDMNYNFRRDVHRQYPDRAADG
jgi:hypothetical protein